MKPGSSSSVSGRSRWSYLNGWYFLNLVLLPCSSLYCAWRFCLPSSRSPVVAPPGPTAPAWRLQAHVVWASQKSLRISIHSTATACLGTIYHSALSLACERSPSPLSQMCSFQIASRAEIYGCFTSFLVLNSSKRPFMVWWLSLALLSQSTCLLVFLCFATVTAWGVAPLPRWLVSVFSVGKIHSMWSTAFCQAFALS